MNYYNEWDSFAAEWLKELIKDGLIPDGIVDQRSIIDVEPEELKGFTQCHFFAGIGGWSRALQIAGWSPDRPVWTGSPPCQSFSTAGKGKGKDDERHLWPVFFNLIRECQPPTVFGEQVAAAIRFGWLDDLQIDFEKEGYAAGAFVLPSGSIGAPHKRDRLFFVADSNSRNRWREQEPKQQARDQRRQPDGDSGIASSVADSGIHGQPRQREMGRPGDTTQSGIKEVNRAINASGFGSSVPSCHEKPLADSNADGRKQGLQQIPRGSSERPRSDGLDSRPVGHADNPGPQVHGEPGELHLRESDRESANRLSADPSVSDYRDGLERFWSDSVGNSNSNRPESRDETAETARHWDSIDAASFWSGSVGDSKYNGSYGAEVGRSPFETSNCGKKGQDVSCESEGAGRSEIARDIRFWEDSITIYCRDGKYRPIPIEPSLFPLANGISNRVGILRGAGNAIVPQAAAEIIKAVM